MNILGRQLSSILRRIRLLPTADYLRYLLLRLKHQSKNVAFQKKHPDIKLPPDYLMYESFQLDYQKYFEGGRKTAQWIWECVQPHINPSPTLKVLEWGCGPGRIIRHFPAILGDEAVIKGTDYNAQSIAWCTQNIPEVEFTTNQLAPPLPYPSASFDLAYAISIFTHLSEKMHTEWMQEILRVLQPRGIFFFTTQGDHFLTKLTKEERQAYLGGQLITRSKVKEGHRTFSAFHPPAFIQTLIHDQILLEHFTPHPEPNKALPQDVWMIQKR